MLIIGHQCTDHLFIHLCRLISELTFWVPEDKELLIIITIIIIIIIIIIIHCDLILLTVYFTSPAVKVIFSHFRQFH